MSDPIPDPALDVVDAFIAALLKVFNPTPANSAEAPLGGGTTTVRFVAGNTVPLALWDAHAQGTNCREPFVWVRVVSSFHSRAIPAATVTVGNCDLPEVLRIEIGVARCSSLGYDDGTVDWDAQRLEAEYSMDDRRRINLAMCVAKRRLKNHAVALDTLVPQGPDGGIYAWAGTAFVGLIE